MKIDGRHLLLLLAGIAAVALLFYLALPRKVQEQAALPAVTPQATPAQATPVPTEVPPVPAIPPATAATGPAYQSRPSGGALKDPEQVRKAAENFNVPINFWGKVIDQERLPLAGAKVRYSVRYMATAVAGFPDYRSDFYEVTTGNDGLFVITGKTGDSLTIETLTKEGYRGASREQRGFAYAQAPAIFKPDQQRPMVFTMVKAAEVSQLKRFSGRLGVPYNGTSLAIDPLTGRRGGSGELKISCLREPPSGTVPDRDYPWKLMVKLEGGGLVPVEPGAIYEAPAEGYQPQLDYEMKAGVDWKSSVRQEYYFKTAQNLYGRLSVDVSLRNDEPDAFVAISGMVNPTGSRVLEPAASVP